MLIAEVINGSVTQYPLTVYQLRTMYPNVSWPDEPDSASLLDYNLVSVQETNIPSIGRNQIVQEATPTYDSENSRWVQVWSIVSTELSVAIATEKQLIAETRYNNEILGINFNYRTEGDVPVVTDRESQIKLFSAYTMAKDGYWVDGSSWKFGDGVFREMTAQEVISMSLAVAGYVQACFARERALCLQVESAATLAEAESWTWEET